MVRSSQVGGLDTVSLKQLVMITGTVSQHPAVTRERCKCFQARARGLVTYQISLIQETSPISQRNMSSERDDPAIVICHASVSMTTLAHSDESMLTTLPDLLDSSWTIPPHTIPTHSRTPPIQSTSKRSVPNLTIARRFLGRWMGLPDTDWMSLWM